MDPVSIGRVPRLQSGTRKGSIEHRTPHQCMSSMSSCERVNVERAPIHQFPRIAIDDGEEARNHLAKYGFVIFRDVASSKELREAESLFWAWAEAQELGIRRDTPVTLRPSCWRDLSSSDSTFRSGLISQRGIGGSPFMWRVRTMPGVARAFAAAWDVGADDLLTGFDSCAVTRNLWLFEEHAQEQACARATAANSSTAGAGVAGVDDASHSWALNREKAQWFHVDQHAHALPGLSTYQGLLTFYPCNHATGGTVLVPKSHKRFASIFSAQNGNAREPASEGFVALDKPGDHENFCAGAVQVSLESGDLLLWD